MKEAIYERTDGLDRVWQYEIMPLLEDLFYGQRDLAEHYGLPGCVRPSPRHRPRPSRDPRRA